MVEPGHRLKSQLKERLVPLLGVVDVHVGKKSPNVGLVFKGAEKTERGVNVHYTPHWS